MVYDHECYHCRIMSIINNVFVHSNYAVIAVSVFIECTLNTNTTTHKLLILSTGPFVFCLIHSHIALLWYVLQFMYGYSPWSIVTD